MCRNTTAATPASVVNLAPRFPTIPQIFVRAGGAAKNWSAAFTPSRRKRNDAPSSRFSHRARRRPDRYWRRQFYGAGAVADRWIAGGGSRRNRICLRRCSASHRRAVLYLSPQCQLALFPPYGDWRCAGPDLRHRRASWTRPHGQQSNGCHRSWLVAHAYFSFELHSKSSEPELCRQEFALAAVARFSDRSGVRFFIRRGWRAGNSFASELFRNVASTGRRHRYYLRVGARNHRQHRALDAGIDQRASFAATPFRRCAWRHHRLPTRETSARPKVENGRCRGSSRRRSAVAVVGSSYVNRKPFSRGSETQRAFHRSKPVIASTQISLSSLRSRTAPQSRCCCSSLLFPPVQ